MASTDLSLLKSAVDTASNLQAQAAENAAAAAASGITASGDLTESQSYGTAKQLSERNAALEGVSGEIVALQEQRKVRDTIGGQAASVAASGFSGDSGTSIALLRSSVQQGYLTDQLNSVQTQINQGGFLEQGIASETERVAAENASKASLLLQQQQAAAGERATANAAAQTAAIEQYLKAQNPTGAALSPEEQAKNDVVTATLRNTDGSAVKLPASAVPGAAAQNGGLGTDGTSSTLGSTGPVRDQFGRPLAGGAITSTQVNVSSGRDAG